MVDYTSESTILSQSVSSEGGAHPIAGGEGTGYICSLGVGNVQPPKDMFFSFFPRRVLLGFFLSLISNHLAKDVFRYLIFCKGPVYYLSGKGVWPVTMHHLPCPTHWNGLSFGHRFLERVVKFGLPPWPAHPYPLYSQAPLPPRLAVGLV